MCLRRFEAALTPAGARLEVARNFVAEALARSTGVLRWAERAGVLLTACAGLSLACARTQRAEVAHPPRVLHYEISLTSDMVLSVDATFPPGTQRNWWVDPPAMPYLGAVQARDLHGDAPLPPDTAAMEQRCNQRGCRVTYEFDLERAAREIDSRRVAAYLGESILSPPSSWLLRPRGVSVGYIQRYRVTTPPDLAFGTGSTPSKTVTGAFEAPLPRGFHAPYAAFGPLRHRPIDIGDARLDVHLLFSKGHPRENETLDFIRESAESVAKYYGSFPAEVTAVFVSDRSYHGSQMGIGGSSVILGMNPTRAGSARGLGGRSWIAVHEMVHVGFPSTGREHRWATEGIATYVESVARCQAGLISRDELWRLFLERMQLGNPRPGDRGLDRTPTWARTYWGGALFWFVTDVRLLQATNGKSGLKEALRGLVAAGGNSAEYWPLVHTLRRMDQEIDTEVVSQMYQQHALSPVVIDLDEVFARLGVARRGGEILYDEAAPDAPLRRVIEGSRSITFPP